MAMLCSILLCCAFTVHAVVFQPQGNFQPLAGGVASLPVDLVQYYNNRAFGIQPGDADFDGKGDCYPATNMPPASFYFSGVNFSFPVYQEAGNDNVRANGQVINVPRQKYSGFEMLAAAESRMASASIVATYADGTNSTAGVMVPKWWSAYPSGGALVFPYFLTNTTANFNTSMIYQTSNWLDSSKELVSLTLPAQRSLNTNLHVFALTMLPVDTDAHEGSAHGNAHLEVIYARSTQKWIEGSDQVQIMEVQVRNVGKDFVLRKNNVRLSVASPGVDTVVEGKILRLGPGDQATVEIGVRRKAHVAAGSSGPATIIISAKGLPATKPYKFDANYGIRPYDESYESLYTHEAPDWYSKAKYGIFIHWGIYSIPGWGGSGATEGYAEWYWQSTNAGPHNTPDTYDYDLQTYGPNVVYDDFIQEFTADAWDPKEWVDLFADAGANYFVQVTKHHDGYALFDLPEKATKRTSVQLVPHRNLLQELFDAAKMYHPQLHRATYLSLPEWYNPAYKPYGFSYWPGGNASNPFTNQTLPYTGYVDVADYLTDTLLPEMETLADMGTEIMWCDVGGPNVTAQFASAWFNTAAAQNRQVAMNDRCGLPGDFDTPEYAKYAGALARKWESNLGMDPHSFGYNRETPMAAYMNASTIVTNLIDIVSKNGNFLLDIGPMGNGSILDVEQRNLREAGVWIKDHAESIFDTTYWFVTPQEGENYRFTLREDAFYIHSLAPPTGGAIVLNSPVPWVEGDVVTVVGGRMAGHSVPATRLANGSLTLNVSEDMVMADQFTWVFKIPF